MNTHQFLKIIAPLYRDQPPHLGFEQAQRLERWASELISEPGPGEPRPDNAADRAVVQTLALLVLLAPQLRSNRGPRASLEAFLVQEGWGPRRARELFRSLENLPDKPKTPEEALVADAYTLIHLGHLGFAMHLTHAAVAGEPMTAALDTMRKFLTRRLYTPVGGRRAQKGRAELKALMMELGRALEE